ncbi:MAG: hypothetical protein R6U43_06230 [Candidatus Krumholzibacteriales bacterium]
MFQRKYTKRFSIKFMTLALVAAAAILSLAKPGPGCLASELPPAEEVIESYIEATGGREAYARIDNIMTTGKFEMPDQGMVMNITSYNARPNLMYAVIESPQLGKIERGVSREGVAWENSMMTGPSIKEGKEKRQMLNDALIDRMIRWKDIYSKAENKGIEEVDGKECYKVVFTTKSGNAETSYFDRESGLLVKTEKIVHSQMGDMPSVAAIGDYRETDGILTSFVTEVTLMGQTRKITLEKIETNIELPDTLFDLPEEIASLLEKKKEAETE